MSPAYRDAVSTYLPEATIVSDHFPQGQRALMGRFGGL